MAQICIGRPPELASAGDIMAQICFVKPTGHDAVGETMEHSRIGRPQGLVGYEIGRPPGLVELQQLERKGAANHKGSVNGEVT